MSAKCVIRKLENEGYITVKQYVNMIDGYYEINSKHKEAIDGIIAKNNGDFLTFVFKNNHKIDIFGMDILDLEKVHERLKMEAEKHPNKEVLEIYRPLGRFENSKELRRWINDNTDFHFGGKANGVLKHGFKVINKKVKKENIIKKEQERTKLLEILNTQTKEKCDNMLEEKCDNMLHNFVTYNKKERYEEIITKKVFPILFDTSTITIEILGPYDDNEVIKNNVDPLPKPVLVDLILKSDEFRYVIIDYEIDKVSAYDNMHEVLNHFKKLEAFDNLQPEDEKMIMSIITED